jgi:cell division GTPase FtsZ
MKICAIGLGQCGGKILDTLLEHDSRASEDVVSGFLAANTAKADLLGLNSVPRERQVLYGQHRVNGNGVGADNEMGASVAEEDVGEILDGIDSTPVHQTDAFLLIAGLGGGTGSGALPVVARHLKRIYQEPVYGLGILPGTDEGGIYSLNAARSFKTAVEHVDNLLLFDNDAWVNSGDSVQQGFKSLNEELVRRLLVLFRAGETPKGAEVSESVVDSSEIINTLGDSGVSTIGYATDTIETRSGGLLSGFLSGNDSESHDSSADVNRIQSLVRKAALGRLTIPIETESVERGLVVIAGPPERLSRKGSERARTWLEQETGTMEVRGGDFPIPDSNHLGAVVLFSGATDIPRVKKLQRVAIEADGRIDTIRQEHSENLAELVSNDNDELDTLF